MNTKCAVYTAPHTGNVGAEFNRQLRTTSNCQHGVADDRRQRGADFLARVLLEGYPVVSLLVIAGAMIYLLFR